MEKYFGGFDNYGDMRDDYSRYDRDCVGKVEPKDFPSEDEILLASYDDDYYAGNAVVLFLRDGKYFLDASSHCSCFGLEDSWDPQEIAKEQLLNCPMKGGDNAHEPEALILWHAIAFIANPIQ